MDSLALYIHWPFCLSKCPYCDFNSHVRERVDPVAWERALLQELRRVAEKTGPRRLTSIFFGGGTPSLMPPSLAGALVETAHELFEVQEGLEVTLEANPNSVEIDRFQDFRSAGINRVSIGVQSLVAEDLTFLGRTHGVDEALRAIDVGQRVFERVSFDLIYARPGQTVAAWEKELTQALAYGTEHLSVYQLTIEPGTAFATRHGRGDFAIPEDDLAGELYEFTQATMEAAGLPAYEISNHAKKGCASRHNLAYWRYDDYAGVGPGAHGRLSQGAERFATKQFLAPETWLEKVSGEACGDDSVEPLDAETQSVEALMMGLRLTHGIDTSNLPLPLDQVVDVREFQWLKENGFLEQDGHTLRATASGRQRLNAVLAKLLGK